MAQQVRVAAGEQVAPQQLSFLVAGVAQNLSGGTLSATLRRVDVNPYVDRPATGTLAAGANLGAVTYTPSAADAAAGDYELILAATFSGPKLSVADAIFMAVRARA